MSDLNTAAFTARLTRDPELHRTQSGDPVTTLRVAIGRRRGSGGQDRGAAFWDVEVWGKMAESCCRYLAKGRRIGVEGTLDHREWKKDGATRDANFVKASWVEFLDPPPRSEAAAAADPSPPPASADGGQSEEDDIPF